MPWSRACLLVAGLAAGVLVLADGPGRSAARADSGRQCFLASNVSGFIEATDRSVILTVSPGRYYRMDMFGTCNDLDFSEVIGIRATAGSPWICSELEAELVVPSAIGPRRCLVRNLRRLSEAEVAALRQPRRR